MSRDAGVAIHPSAVIDEDAVLDPSVQVGPYSVIGPGVEIARDVQLGPHVVVERDTRIAEGCRISAGAVLGSDPQDLKYMGERTWLEVGPRTVIREYATVNRGTAAVGTTSVGADCLLMAYVHVAHDCRLGDHVILANSVNMGGHVDIGDWAVVGGLTAIHQFVRIGAHAMVGGAARVSQDVAPYSVVGGSPAATYGVNRIGLERRGFEAETIRELKRAMRAAFRGSLPFGRALDELDADEPCAEVAAFIAFARETRRGVTPGRRGAEPPDA